LTTTGNLPVRKLEVDYKVVREGKDLWHKFHLKEVEAEAEQVKHHSEEERSTTRKIANTTSITKRLAITNTTKRLDIASTTAMGISISISTSTTTAPASTSIRITKKPQ